MNQQNLNYLSSPVLQKAKEEIENPSHKTHYEHHVGTWIGTLLKNVFTGDPWAITSEKADNHSKKRPDFVIDKLENNNLYMHLVCEIKKHKGDRMENALNQAISGLIQTMDETGNQRDNMFELYVIVQRGVNIGFFEYHNDVSNLEEEGIKNFRGCVSLTQDQTNGTAIIPDTTHGLKRLMFDDGNLRSTNDEEKRLRNEAKGYNIPCIFNLNLHAYEIDSMMTHILKNPPRSSC